METSIFTNTLPVFQATSPIDIVRNMMGMLQNSLLLPIVTLLATGLGVVLIIKAVLDLTKYLASAGKAQEKPTMIVAMFIVGGALLITGAFGGFNLIRNSIDMVAVEAGNIANGNVGHNRGGGLWDGLDDRGLARPDILGDYNDGAFDDNYDGNRGSYNEAFTRTPIESAEHYLALARIVYTDISSDNVVFQNVQQRQNELLSAQTTLDNSISYLDSLRAATPPDPVAIAAQERIVETNRRALNEKQRLYNYAKIEFDRAVVAANRAGEEARRNLAAAYDSEGNPPDNVARIEAIIAFADASVAYAKARVNNEDWSEAWQVYQESCNAYNATT